jgi:hypothetical protein
MIPRRRIFALLLLLGFLSARTAHAQTTQLPCPAGSINLQTEIHFINQPCDFDGDIVLGGTATLVVLQTTLVVDGDILLSGSARLIVSGAMLTLDNHFVFDHRIESHDNAQIHFINSILKTNASSPGHSLASQYIGRDQSVLVTQSSGVLMPDSWLLGDVRGTAAVHAIGSNFPSEIYPHERATVILQGPTTTSRVWLEFLSGSESLIEHLPNELAPFDWSFGRNTPGLTNVGYQVEIIGAQPTIGVSSHPGSHVTFRDTDAALAIGYFLSDPASPELISGVGPLSNNVVLDHQGRLFELDNATIFEFAWQIYAANPTAVLVQPVIVYQSIVNEIAAMDRGLVAVDACLMQWAVIAAVGPGSKIEINNSVINSQSIIAATDAIVHIDSSEIFGSLVEATDSASVLFSNVKFSPNICHALCLPACSSAQAGGSPESRCNPFNPAGGASVFKAGGRATIAALGLQPIDAPVTKGSVLDLRGDLFLYTGPDATHTYSYTLRYNQIGTTVFPTIVANAQGPKRGASLGILNTSNLAAGNYQAILELHVDGTLQATVTRPFTLVQ